MRNRTANHTGLPCPDIRIMYIMSNEIAAYWWPLIPLAALAWHRFPRSSRR